MNRVVVLKHKDGTTHYAEDDFNSTDDINSAVVLQTTKKANNLADRWTKRISESPIPTSVFEEKKKKWVVKDLEVPFVSAASVPVTITT